MVTGDAPVANTNAAESPGQSQSNGDAQCSGRTASVGAAKTALVILAKILAHRAAAEVVEQREHEGHLNHEAKSHER